MFKLSVSLFALALVLLPSFAAALTVDANSTSTGHGFGCSYEISPGTGPGGVANEFGPIAGVSAANINDCMESCDKDTKCLFATFSNPKNSENCQKFEYLRYVPTPGVGAKGSSLIELVPYSCKKDVASHTAHVCYDQAVRLENGCLFNVMCETRIKRSDDIGYVELTETPHGCAEKVASIKDAVAFEWYNGGKCLIAEKRKGAAKKYFVEVEPSKDFQTWQLFKGSCPKQV